MGCLQLFVLLRLSQTIFYVVTKASSHTRMTRLASKTVDDAIQQPDVTASWEIDPDQVVVADGTSEASEAVLTASRVRRQQLITILAKP